MTSGRAARSDGGREAPRVWLWRAPALTISKSFKPPPTAAVAAVSPPYPRRGVLYETSANQLFHHAAVHVGKPHVAPGVKIGKQRVVEPHQV
jgi:hypothetical protein